MHATEEMKDERRFEKIFVTLSKAAPVILKTVPIIKQQCVEKLEMCRRQEAPVKSRAMWTPLDQKTSQVIRLAEQLKVRLASIKLKEPGVENDVDFWQLCGAFVRVL